MKQRWHVCIDPSTPVFGTDGADPITGIDFPSLKKAKQAVKKIYQRWMSDHADASDDEWNDMIENWYAEIYDDPYCNSCQELPDYPDWQPSDRWLERIGWKPRPEQA